VARGIVTHPRDIALETPEKHPNKKELIMKRKEQSVLLAGLLALGLAACSSPGMRDTASTSGATVDSTYGSAASNGDTGATSGDSMAGTATGTTDSTSSPASGGSTTGSSTYGTSGSTGSTAGTMGDQSTTAGTGTAGTSAGTAGTTPPAGPPNAVVTSIDVIPRQSGTTAGGAGTVAGAAVGGATGTTGTAERVYRITLRMDDGTTRMVTQETAPAFRPGDRVHMSSNMIQR
jgi:hypothetical protein